MTLAKMMVLLGGSNFGRCKWLCCGRIIFPCIGQHNACRKIVAVVGIAEGYYCKWCFVVADLGKCDSSSCFLGSDLFDKNFMTATITITAKTNFIIIAITLTTEDAFFIAVIKFENSKGWSG